MTIRFAFGVPPMFGAVLLLLGGCRRPTPGFAGKANVPAASIERAVMFAPVPGNPQSGYYETRDPRLIARLVEGLHTASARPGDPVTKESRARLYLVPRTGRPLFFGLVLRAAEDHYGRTLADAVDGLLKQKPTLEFDAIDTGRTDLTGLRNRAR